MILNVSSQDQPLKNKTKKAAKYFSNLPNHLVNKLYWTELI